MARDANAWIDHEIAGCRFADERFRTIRDLDRAVAERCVAPDAAPDLHKGRVDFHWWPKPTTSA